MRLVGAKNSYIRGPFFFEGAWVGLLGAIVPSIIIYFGYKAVYASVNPQFEAIAIDFILRIHSFQ